MANGVQWQTIRRFNVTALRNLGVGKMRTQTLILDEVQYFSDQLERGCGRPTEVHPMVRTAIVNILCMVMLGFHPQPRDKRLDTINRFLDETHIVVKAVEPLQMFPWLRFVPGKYRGVVDSYRETMKRLGKMFRKEIAQHDHVSLDVDGLRDYVEAFLFQQARELEEKSGEAPYFDGERDLLNDWIEWLEKSTNLTCFFRLFCAFSTFYSKWTDSLSLWRTNVTFVSV